MLADAVIMSLLAEAADAFLGAPAQTATDSLRQRLRRDPVRAAVRKALGDQVDLCCYGLSVGADRAGDHRVEGRALAGRAVPVMACGLAAARERSAWSVA